MINIFTGLIEEIGKIIYIKNSDKSLKLKIQCDKVIKEAKIGDSIATNGVCLTATEIGKNFFVADCMFETIKRTDLKNLTMGDGVNLEKSITLATPLGGHLVTGDIDCVGKIINITREGIARIFEIEIPQKYLKYVVMKGRIAIDGASLTVMDLTHNSFSVSLIPHTQEKIILGQKGVGSGVNIETDIVGKYIERFMTFKSCDEKKSITHEFLLENGF